MTEILTKTLANPISFGLTFGIGMASALKVDILLINLIGLTPLCGAERWIIKS